MNSIGVYRHCPRRGHFLLFEDPCAETSKAGLEVCSLEAARRIIIDAKVDHGDRR